MIIVVLAVAVVVVLTVVAVVAVVTSRRRSADPPAASHATTEPDPVLPMTGLESALSQVTDRTGRPIREAIDAEASHVDDLRVPDDTGPLLRRALDHVARPEQDDGARPDDAPTG